MNLIISVPQAISTSLKWKLWKTKRITTITINKANRGSWIPALFSYLFSLELLNSKETTELVLFSTWSLFGMKSFGRHKSEQYDRELCPSFGEKSTLSASLQWCGSQTPKDTPPVPGYKHSNWLPSCLEAAQLSAGGMKNSWRFACIYYLPCGKTAWVL